MQVHTIGIDLAKNVFQIHGVDESDKVVVARQLRRKQVIPFFEKLKPCLVGMEACAQQRIIGHANSSSLGIPMCD